MSLDSIIHYQIPDNYIIYIIVVGFILFFAYVIYSGFINHKKELEKTLKGEIKGFKNHKKELEKTLKGDINGHI